MASSTFSSEQRSETGVKQYIEGIRFDRVMVVLNCWMVSGLYLDGWAHAHGFVDNTFFTPWHAILYSGYLANAVLLVIVTYINHRRGRSWMQATPLGYGLSILGVPLFIVAGGGDLIWHTLFGFELGIAPLLSPTHLLLAFAGFLLISGALRATWRRSNGNGWRELLPAVLSLLTIFCLFSFFMSFNHPIVNTELINRGFRDDQQSSGVAGILLQAVVMLGIFLFALRRWKLPIGTFTLLITVNVALMSLFSDEYRFIPAALLTGISADLLYWRLQPSLKRVDGLRIFAFSVPVIFYLLYFATFALTDTIAWTIHLWLGSSIMTGVVGLLLSYVMVPPSEGSERADPGA